MSQVLLAGPQSPAGPNYHHWNLFLKGFGAAFEIDQPYIQGKWNSNPDTEHSDGGQFLIGNTPVPIAVFDTHEGEPGEEAAMVKLVQRVENKAPAVVCGFVTSQAASAFLELTAQKLQSRSGDWPAVILPMATSSDLLRRDHNQDGRLPILRLVPHNSAQVAAISSHIAEIQINEKIVGSKSVAIFRDGDNILYARNLADAFRVEAEQRHVPVVIDSIFGSERSCVDVALLVHRPDYIVFFGMLNSAVLLLRQINRLMELSSQCKPPFAPGEDGGEWRPHIIISDGSCRTSLHEQFTRYKELDKVIGFFPVSRIELEPQHPFSQNLRRALAEGPSFFSIAHDTAIIINHLLRFVVEREKRPIEPSALATALRNMSEFSRSPSSPRFQHDHFVLGSYRFDRWGDVENKVYEAWALQKGHWVPYPPKSNSTG